MLKIKSTDHTFSKCFHKEDSDCGLGWSETSFKEEEDDLKDGRILKREKGPVGSSLSVYEIFPHPHSLESCKNPGG